MKKVSTCREATMSASILVAFGQPSVIVQYRLTWISLVKEEERYGNIESRKIIG
jgi:hypothetical protein